MLRRSIRVRWWSLSSTHRTYTNSKTLPYPKEAIFEVVADVGKYNEFLPYVNKSIIVSGDSYVSGSKEEARFSALLDVGFQLFSESYTSEVSAIPFSKVTSRSTDNSVFSYLASEWNFTEIDSTTCHVDFKLEYLVGSPLLRITADRTIQEVAESQVIAIEKRCKQLSLQSTPKQVSEDVKDFIDTNTETDIKNIFASTRLLALKLGLSEQQIESAYRNASKTTPNVSNS